MDRNDNYLTMLIFPIASACSPSIDVAEILYIYTPDDTFLFLLFFPSHTKALYSVPPLPSLAKYSFTTSPETVKILIVTFASFVIL